MDYLTCKRERRIPFSAPEPRMPIVFLCKTEADWVDLQRRSAEINNLDAVQPRRSAAQSLERRRSGLFTHDIIGFGGPRRRRVGGTDANYDARARSARVPAAATSVSREDQIIWRR